MRFSSKAIVDFFILFAVLGLAFTLSPVHAQTSVFFYNELDGSSLNVTEWRVIVDGVDYGIPYSTMINVDGSVLVLQHVSLPAQRVYYLQGGGMAVYLPASPTNISISIDYAEDYDRVEIYYKSRLVYNYTSRSSFAFAANPGTEYTLKLIRGGYVYQTTFLTDVETVQITPVELYIPENVRLAYQYIRVWAELVNGTAYIYYEDTTQQPANLTAYLYNFTDNALLDSQALQGVTSATISFPASGNGSYVVKLVIEHPEFGNMTWKQGLTPFPATMILTEEAPLGFSVLGSIGTILATAILIIIATFTPRPFVAAGALAFTLMAAFFTAIGWISIPFPILAFFMVISFGIAVTRGVGS